MEAVAHLVKNVSARYVLVGKDPAMQAIMKGALDVLRLSADHSVFLSSVSFPSFEDLFTGPSEYTSSTAHPKAIPFNNRRIIQLSLIPYFSDQDLTDKVFAIQGLPMFHLMGVLQMIMSSARKTDSDYIYCVPAFAEAWARNDECVAWFSGRGIIFGGGSLNKNTGDYLTAHSVSIDQVYGSTECGGVNIFCPARNQNLSRDDDWEYFRMLSYEYYSVSWVPIDMAARAIRYICFSDSYYHIHPTRVLHLARLKLAPWSSIALALSNVLSVTLVPYDLWDSNIEKCSTVPAYKLLEFFQTSVTSHRPNVEAFGLPMLDSSLAFSISSTSLIPDYSRYARQMFYDGYHTGTRI
ncbi:hypothetical protein EDD18DRAFT_1332227 [Armillaria luteobubalina]|uniref:AMP-dependent synthetase/ligase domain-containing protein n=1 Tax=Armillaria luteobubalina TaxID=153913 RepID=A0AA39Q715_9AGAR|nr:hypothetical protein EDD18DRAFT_1332227 [Armillaria luteobubalina]